MLHGGIIGEKELGCYGRAAVRLCEVKKPPATEGAGLMLLSPEKNGGVWCGGIIPPQTGSLDPANC
jgi:hypothetical protein